MLQKVNFLTVSIAACITCPFPAKEGEGTLCGQVVHAWVDDHHQESSRHVARNSFYWTKSIVRLHNAVFNDV